MAVLNGNPKRLVAEKRHFPQQKKRGSGAKKAVASMQDRLKAIFKRTPKPQKTKSKPKTKPARRPLVLRILAYIGKLIWWIVSRFALAGAVVLGAAVLYFASTLPDAKTLMDARSKGSITLLDKNGAVFAWRGDQFGGIVDPNTVSPHLRNAVVATEDKRFYRHLGVSPRGMAGAIRTNMREGRNPLSGHGGSTITQQVAKRVFFADLPTYERKIKEIPMSLAMELKYSKDDILAIYLNRAYLGEGTHGFEAASQRYFGKSSAEVSPAEAAMMAGLLKAPSRDAPTRSYERARKRADLIVGLMEEQGYLTKAQAESARINPAKLSPKAKAQRGRYFADWVIKDAPDFIIKDSQNDVVIRTTFDAALQRKAEEAIDFIFETKVRKGSKAQAASVLMSRDGAVRAMVGGREVGPEGSFNRATQARRQTGSSFKPFVYAAALESGYRYDTKVIDQPITIDVPGSGPWSPKNYTKKFKGEMTLTEALAQSINTIAVEVSEDVGRARVAAVAKDFGIASDLAPGPAMALGTSESTLIEMTGAYAGLMNGGVSVAPHGLTQLTIQGDSTPLLGKETRQGLRVMSAETAGQLTFMMQEVINNGTGGRASLGTREAAGKTGTTQGARDAWFIGYTADYVLGVWMGYDDNSKLNEVTGGSLPADIWHETMLRVHEGLPETPLTVYLPPKPVVQAPVTARPQVQAPKTVDQALKDIETQIAKDLKGAGKDLKTVLKGIGSIFSGNKNQ